MDLINTGRFVRASYFTLILALAVATVEAGGELPALPSSLPKVDRHPVPASWTRAGLSALPHFDVAHTRQESWQVDLRHRDLSDLDLRDRLDDLFFASFDDGTRWPSRALLPERFDPARMMELGKDPGLGLRKLHGQGVTGRGVGIAIIDQTLFVDHKEYVDQLRLYEEADDITGGWLRSDMHGAAVASIAVGKTVGVAPGADLYFIATSLGGDGKDFSALARCVRRILTVNAELPKERKIRVIAMAIGWDHRAAGYKEITAATREAKAKGLLVVCSSMEKIHGLQFHGLGRAPLADPNRFGSFEPGLFWAKDRATAPWRPDRLLVPMDSRATASPHSPTQYAFYRQGGWSWAIPYIAGLYALAAQVDPGITPERFWERAMATGDSVRRKVSGAEVDFGPIVNPRRLIEALRLGNDP